MNKLRLKTPHVGFYLIALSFVLTFVAFIMTFRVYNIFGYRINRWVIFTSVAALWLMGFFLVNALFTGDKQFWVAPIYAVICILLVFAAILFIQLCLAPIGIYFTVNNMGDVEANALGVPRAIAATVLYVVALLCVTVASFFPMAAKQKEVQE